MSLFHGNAAVTLPYSIAIDIFKEVRADKYHLRLDLLLCLHNYLRSGFSRIEVKVVVEIFRTGVQPKLYRWCNADAPGGSEYSSQVGYIFWLHIPMPAG